jgi:Holliday junction resolvase RusA-like endonuclease
VIRLHFSGIPPSSNNAYFQKGRLRVLTAVGKRYKVDVQSVVAQQYTDTLGFFKANVPYALVVRLNLRKETMYCSGREEKAKGRYKVFDVTNRVKLLEDALVTTYGHDDKQHTQVVLLKTLTTDEESTDVWAFNLDEEVGPINEYFTV